MAVNIGAREQQKLVSLEWSGWGWWIFVGGDFELRQTFLDRQLIFSRILVIFCCHFRMSDVQKKKKNEKTGRKTCNGDDVEVRVEKLPPHQHIPTCSLVDVLVCIFSKTNERYTLLLRRICT